MADTQLNGAWRDRRVLITGHTGFVGSWLALMLRRLGAEVDGIAHNADPVTRTRSRWLAEHGVKGHVGDIRDYDTVHRLMGGAPYDCVFHLAAQPLVRAGLEDPRTTLTTNIGGSVNVLEAARSTGPGVLVHVTSDKCYRNFGWPWPYRETDEIGGGDPYSVSKAAAELVFEGYAALFDQQGTGGRQGSRDRQGTLAASVRFGNVIGGGDHAAHRLVPDTMAALAAGAPIELRNASAVRPWQHVLDVTAGLLRLADALAAGRVPAGRVFNFAPPGDGATVHELVSALRTHWARTAAPAAGLDAPAVLAKSDPGFAEEAVLRLDGRRAAAELGWEHHFDLHGAAAAIVEWHRTVDRGMGADLATRAQIDRFLTRVPDLADPAGGNRS
ncbi:CDP-glucose 4,6-dehydratase [Kitasatospora sp. NPDC002551]|uniref:CDP-glucose 4,6-dehydratase n=1 Tax=Kitasatospora sp. NPDC002551 TaxID=3154539 RepID=UPI00332015B2